MRRHEDHEPGQMNTERGPGPIFVGGLKVLSKAGKDGPFSFSRFYFCAYSLRVFTGMGLSSDWSKAFWISTETS